MRTTLDLPDPLMRELKARAALEGLKLKDFLARTVQLALQKPLPPQNLPGRSPAPVFVRPSAKPMPLLTSAELNAILDGQDGLKLDLKSGKY